MKPRPAEWERTFRIRLADGNGRATRACTPHVLRGSGTPAAPLRSVAATADHRGRAEDATRLREKAEDAERFAQYEADEVSLTR